jgi:hypothetical protein
LVLAGVGQHGRAKIVERPHLAIAFDRGMHTRRTGRHKQWDRSPKPLCVNLIGDIGRAIHVLE